MFGVAAAAGIAVVVTLTLELSLWNSGGSTNYDLGIFAQGARSWAAGEWPTSAIRGLPLLGDHFSPLMAITGVAWRIWPDPRSLLVLQALSVGVAVALIVHCFRHAPLAASMAAGTFLLGRSVTAAVLFDVHETTLLCPVVALACCCVVKGHRRGFLLAIALMVLIKEDMGLTGAGFAAAWAVTQGWKERDARRTGLIAAVLSVAGLVVAVCVISRLNPAGGSEYLGFFGLGSPPHGQLHSGGWSWQRLMPAVAFVLTALVVGLRSPLALAAVPGIVWRTASSNPLHWTWDHHYDIQAATIAVFAAGHVFMRPDGGRRAARVMCAVLFMLQPLLSLQQIQERLPSGLTLSAGTRVRAVEELGRGIPRTAPVAALNDAGVYLVADHEHVYDIRRPGLRVRYIMFTTDEEWLGELSRCQRDRLAAGRTGTSAPVVTHRDDVVLVDLGRVTLWRPPTCHA